MARVSKEERDVIRKKILEVSRKFFMESGFENTSTKKIAKEVGIAEGTLFNYFDSKIELFFEIIGEEYDETKDEFVNELILSDNINDVIYKHIIKTSGTVLKIPRRILSELAVASLKMAKKNPERFKKFAELDFKYMREVESYFEFLLSKGILTEVDTKYLAEIIYSIFSYEVLMYMYDKTITKEIMETHIKEKIAIVMNGYYKGGN